MKRQNHIPKQLSPYWLEVPYRFINTDELWRDYIATLPTVEIKEHLRDLRRPLIKRP
jgi:hypothetical protein